MGTHGHDENESSAEYYDGRIGEDLNKLIEIGQELRRKIDDGGSVSYADFLKVERAFEYFEKAVVSRDILGMHSRTGQARFRHIAHPEQYPAPEEKKAELV